jgi:hypothetical protein
LREDNPRDALLIGNAAIEIGCKEFIQAVVPWQVRSQLKHLPSVDQILKNYIPTLPSRGKLARTALIPDWESSEEDKARQSTSSGCLAALGTWLSRARWS